MAAPHSLQRQEPTAVQQLRASIVEYRKAIQKVERLSSLLAEAQQEAKAKHLRLNELVPYSGPTTLRMGGKLLVITRQGPSGAGYVVVEEAQTL